MPKIGNSNAIVIRMRFRTTSRFVDRLAESCSSLFCFRVGRAIEFTGMAVATAATQQKENLLFLVPVPIIADGCCL
jgi:hypothetical protein